MQTIDGKNGTVHQINRLLLEEGNICEAEKLASNHYIGTGIKDQAN